MGKQRAARAAEFMDRVGGRSSFSQALVISANTLLKAALHERRRDCVRSKTNHPADNAVGAIALIATAFDAWLNECVDMRIFPSEAQLVSGFLHPHDGATLASRSLSAGKVVDVAGLLGVTKIDPWPAEIAMLCDLRDEMIHPLIRSPRSEGGVPPWLVELHRRGLFLADRKPVGPDGVFVDFSFSTKLGSYALAYWAFETVESAVEAMCEVPADRPSTEGLAKNFSLYRHYGIPPTDLDRFDSEHGLVLSM